jgi:hypothetical protein
MKLRRRSAHASHGGFRFNLARDMADGAGGESKVDDEVHHAPAMRLSFGIYIPNS